MTIVIITTSDRCARGESVDASGPAAVEFCQEQGWEIAATELLPDDRDAIAAAIRRSVDDLGADLVLTTGGTGLGPRDVTPEATLQVVDRLVLGIAEAMRSESVKITPFAMLSRGVAGMRGRSLIINLPGSPRAVRECLEILRPVLAHAVAIAAGGGH